MSIGSLFEIVWSMTTAMLNSSAYFMMLFAGLCAGMLAAIAIFILLLIRKTFKK